MGKTCYIFAMIFLLIICQIMSCLPKTNLTSDETALLHLKAQIASNTHDDILTRNWSSSSSVCNWIGVSCGVRHHRVISLDLSHMGLTGTISPHLGNLSFLAALDLGHNNFVGSLPQELSLLHRLKFLSIQYNSFTGEIPSWFPFFGRLERLNLRDNSFSGSIPNHLSNLTNLQLLVFSHNSIEGEIPEELGRLHNLRRLSMQRNHLSGGIPSAIFNISTLNIIALTSNELSGTLPNDICRNLPFLQGIYLGHNKLSGRIPSNLSRCSHLQFLGLAHNLFDGGIPAEIGELTNLQYLQLGGNNLHGAVPHNIGNIEKLIGLELEMNEISGGVPTTIFNISSLQRLVLSQNKLVGNLAREIRNLTSLRIMDLTDNFFTGILPGEIAISQVELLRLGSNALTGIIPIDVFNISTLRVLALNGNALSGALPTNICGGSHRLRELYLGPNHLTGVIPDSLSNCSHLKNLDLSDNEFSAFQPRVFGYLPFLHLLHLFGNNLRIDSSSLLSSLSNCRSLTRLAIADNHACGIIPPHVGNLSSSLTFFYAYRCKIKGNIPPHIGNLSNLVVLSLYGNQLSGNIPCTIKNLYKLQALFLQNNNIRGPILDGLCGLNRLSSLVLSQNQLSGRIPECLGNVTSLRDLYLDSNQLSSNIPSRLGSLKDLLNLDLSSNYLRGPLPLQIENLVAAIYINLSMNQLSESIPSMIGKLQNLVNLSLAFNRLEGSVPMSVGSMLSLVSLDLSHNNLSGFIPKSMEALGYLEYLNVSFNDLSGEIPTGGPFKNFTMESFQDNEALCGPPRFHVPPCHTISHHGSKSKKMEFGLFIVSGVVVLVAIVCLAMIFTRCTRKENGAVGADGLRPIVRERISYYEILEATERFNERNLLGVGSFGSVYRGLLRDGKTIAVKVFRLQSEAAFRSFDVECDILRSVRHINLIKVISSCCNEDFKALVLEYMPNGSLEKWLYSHNCCLDVLQRFNIMIDVASALEYLHHGYSTPIVHCDLKPSNVLLNEEMIAHISDFGIAKLLGTEESNALTNTLATLGYIAPEYGLEGVVSTKCDVYSYGIMLMETFTRKRPSDDMFGGDLSLRSWVERSFPQLKHQVIDANLLNMEEEKQFNKTLQCVSCILELALKCTAESPPSRINMKEVVADLHKIKHRCFSS